jgi:hypothetical protein
MTSRLAPAPGCNKTLLALVILLHALNVFYGSKWLPSSPPPLCPIISAAAILLKEVSFRHGSMAAAGISDYQHTP